MRTIPFVRWIAHAAASLTGPHGGEKRGQGETRGPGCPTPPFRLSVPDPFSSLFSSLTPLAPA